MSYIQDEDFTGLSSATLTLSADFLEGSPIINFNGRLIYGYTEDKANDKIITLDKAPIAADAVIVSYYTINEIDRLNSIRYVTVRQVEALSGVATLTALTNAQIEKLIRQAENHINSIVGYHKKYYDFIVEGGMQKNTFPTVDDGYITDADYPAIPYEITMAALYATENIHLLGSVTASSSYESEKLGDYSYKKKAGNNQFDYSINQIGERAMSMLRGYITRTGEMDILQQEVPVDTLNSRQRFLNQR